MLIADYMKGKDAMNYKLSFFNEQFSYGGRKYLWNTKSGALIKLDDNGEKYINSFNGKEDDSIEFHILKDNGLVVPYEFDEVGKILFDEERNMYNRFSETVFFTIAPGMNCNYHCVYCFENGRDRAQKMTDDTVLSVIDFIKKRIVDNFNLKRLNIKWFGGEPLLYLDIIREISMQLIQFCEERHITYDASIITNGSLLVPEVCDSLAQLHVEKAQITIDGLEEEYCHSKGTTISNFESTISNIRCACERMNLSIRLNIQDNDSDKAIRTTDFLLKEMNLAKKIGVYFAFVRDYNKPSIEEDYRHFSKEYIKWLSHMIDEYQWQTFGNKPMIKTTSCASIRINNFCIGPQGELYKCEHCIGNPEQAIGNVLAGEYFNRLELEYLTTLSSRKRSACIECKYLPLCLGGCANDTVERRLGFDCEAYKDMQRKQKIMYAGL